MGHRCCSKQKVKRGLWSPEEDEKLVNFISSHGLSSWSSVPKFAGLQRCGKSCRLRWINYLRPDLKKGSFTEEEEITIIEVHRIIGNRWAQIAKHLPGRTDNEVKNFWNSSIKKKLLSQGVDPTTHNLLVSPHKPLPKKITNKAAASFTVDHSHKINGSVWDPLVGFPGFGWNLLENDPCLDNGFGPMWVHSFEDQHRKYDHPREEERVEMAVEEAELERLRRMQILGDHVGFDQGGAPSRIGYNYGFDFGFGDHSAILQSGTIGDAIHVEDQLADSCIYGQHFSF